MSTDYDTLFTYCDFHYMKGTTPTKWRRVALSDLPSHIQEAKGHNTYASIQRFSSPTIPSDGADELHYCEPYMDFDSAGDVAAAQVDVRKAMQFFREEFELDYDQMRVWFSGSKGFHLLLSPTAFGVVPMVDLTYVYKAMFEHVAAFLDLPTLDLTVYTKRRMLRIENTVHAKTSLYKRELSNDEITLPVEEITELARQPLLVPHVNAEDFAGEAVGAAVEFFAQFRAEVTAKREASGSDAGQVTLYKQGDADPVCVQDILGNGLKKPGDRNRATLALAGYFKDTGTPQPAAADMLEQWAVALPPEHRQSDTNHVKANTRSVVATVYSEKQYGFSCRYIRALHAPKTSPDYERVACAGDACPFIRKPDVPEDVVDVHLSAIGDPALLGKSIRTKMRVAGRQESAYIVPGKVTYKANDDSEEEPCKRLHCLLHGAGGVIERDYSEARHSRMLLAMCGVPDQQLATALRREIERSSCKAFTYYVNTWVRVIAMTCVPKAETVVYDAEAQQQRDETGAEFSYQRVYAVTDDFKVNSYYEVIGQVFAHPKDQQATLVVTESRATQDAIEDFDLEVVRPLFDAYKGETKAVFGHLVTDMAVNVCKVAGRKAAIASLLMTMHSPLTLNFAGQTYGGWMQTLMIGDTGEAKSQMVERLVRHVGLGELQSAQSSGRTGLLYTIVQKEGANSFLQWGSFVLNDRRLLVIDEASGMTKSEYAELRNARRDGVFKVNRSVSGEASTRTRLVMLSNPQYGKNMGDYTTGIESVEQLFENADIRRFDLVVGFRHGSVTQAQIDAELAEPVRHVFTSEVLRANLLWAWSRKPEEIVWVSGAQERVKTVARDLNARYEGSDIHLLSQDAPEKIARMAQSVAAMLHSSDSLHNNVVVKPEHVDLAGALVDNIYAAPDLDFELYVKQNADSTIDVDYEQLLINLRTGVTYPNGLEVDELIAFFAASKTINPFVVEAFTDDKSAARAVIKQMFKLGLIKMARGSAGSFEPSNKFKELMRRYSRAARV